MALTQPMEATLELQGNILELPPAALAGLTTQEQEIYRGVARLLQGNVLVIEAKQDMQKDAQVVRLGLRRVGTQQRTPLYEMIRVAGVNYIKIYPWQELAAKLLPELGRGEELALPSYMAGYDYLSISDAEMRELVERGGSKLPGVLDYNLYSQLATLEPFLGVYDDLFTEGYKGYELRVISMDGGGYVTRLTTQDAGRIAREWLMFTLDNATRIADVLHASLKKVPATAYTALLAGQALTEDEKNQQLDASFSWLKPQLADASSYKEAALTALDPVIMEMDKSFGGSSWQMTEELQNGQTYTSDFVFRLEYKEAGETAAVRLSGQTQARFNLPVRISAPGGRILSITEAVRLAPRNIVLDVEQQSAHLRQGPREVMDDVELRRLDGSYYLAVTDVLELLDASLAEADSGVTIRHRDREYPLPFIHLDGRDYVKVKDLVPLGFKVTWLPALQVIQLEEIGQP